MDGHLVRAIVDMVVFLEFAGEEILDADASIDAMEQLASNLQRMPRNEQQALICQFQELACEYGDKQEFVRHLHEALGLA